MPTLLITRRFRVRMRACLSMCVPVCMCECGSGSGCLSMCVPVCMCECGSGSGCIFVHGFASVCASQGVSLHCCGQPMWTYMTYVDKLYVDLQGPCRPRLPV